MEKPTLFHVFFCFREKSFFLLLYSIYVALSMYKIYFHERAAAEWGKKNSEWQVENFIDFPPGLDGARRTRLY